MDDDILELDALKELLARLPEIENKPSAGQQRFMGTVVACRTYPNRFSSGSYCGVTLQLLNGDRAWFRLPKGELPPTEGQMLTVDGVPKEAASSTVPQSRMTFIQHAYIVDEACGHIVLERKGDHYACGRCGALAVALVRGR